jgi:hypothetical protein
MAQKPGKNGANRSGYLKIDKKEAMQKQLLSDYQKR